MTRSMAPTIAAVERITPPAGPSVSRLAESYNNGHADGVKAGRAEAFATLRWAAIPLLLIGYLTACAVRLM